MVFRAAARALVFAALWILCAGQSANAAPPPATVTGKAWPVLKDAWSAEDEQGFSDFVRAIGETTCSTIADCLDNPANPYRDPEDPTLFGDCADMAYILRAYYAWKHGLPFAYTNGLRTRDGGGDDLRYSSNGNVVTSKAAAYGPKPVDARQFLRAIGNVVSTAMLRTDPETGGGALWDDWYSIDITRQSVRAGSVAYDIYGHVGIVYNVLDDGRVLIVAAHPDNTVSRSVYGANFLRAKPALGAGLKAWRPIRIVGAKRRPDGALTGGRIVAAKNSELPDFSLIQFYGNVKEEDGAPWVQSEFEFDGRKVSYYDYVRRRLAAPGFRYDPVDELAHGLDEICGAIRDRKAAVDLAIDYGYPKQPHPDKLPHNIYGTYGEWETHSTPSRDARLKVSFIELRRETQKLYEKTLAGDPSVIYQGDNLAADLWKTWLEKKDKCTVTYIRSDNTRVRLNLAHIMDRLWDLSFDPYHCPERRWGASGGELATCPDDEVKTRWYEAERYLRYQAERTYDVRMDFTLAQLKPPGAAPPEQGGLGVEAPADHDLRRYLVSLLPNAVAAEGEAQIYRVNEELPPDLWTPYWMPNHAAPADPATLPTPSGQ